MFQLINRSKKNTIEISNETTIGIFIEDSDRLLQLNLVGLSVHDLQLINSLKPYVERNVVEVVGGILSCNRKCSFFTGGYSIT